MFNDIAEMNEALAEMDQHALICKDERGPGGLTSVARYIIQVHRADVSHNFLVFLYKLFFYFRLSHLLVPSFCLSFISLLFETIPTFQHSSIISYTIFVHPFFHSSCVKFSFFIHLFPLFFRLIALLFLCLFNFLYPRLFLPP